MKAYLFLGRPKGREASAAALSPGLPYPADFAERKKKSITSPVAVEVDPSREVSHI